MIFLDAYSGYNQIKMNQEGKIHTTFIIERGLFCYKVMSFWLKNTEPPIIGSSTKCFKARLGKLWKHTSMTW